MPPTARVRLNNPSLLTWARETAGYTVEQMAEHMGKSPEDICEWESGTAAPTYRQLQDFANKVKRSVAALYLPDVPDEPPLPEDFRTLPVGGTSEFSSESLLAFRELRSSLSEWRDLLRLLAVDEELALPRWRGTDAAVERAGYLRERIGISVADQVSWRNYYAALDEWRWALHGLGVLVQVFAFPIEDVRAFSMIQHDLGGIGLSSRDAPSGRIFSLFHEVGHLCLRRPGVSGDPLHASGANTSAARVERYCDSFAVAFLLPLDSEEVSRAVETIASDFTEETVAAAARRLKVSKDVLARRAHDAGAVDHRDYWRAVEQWRRHGAMRTRSSGGGDFVVNQVSHKGKPFVSDVLQALDAGALTAFEASKMLSLRPGHLEKARSRVT